MAVTITAVLVLVSFAIINLVLKQISISGSARDSEAAFYSADSGVECALFWDLRNPTMPTRSAFATSAPVQSIDCAGTNIAPPNITRSAPVSGAATTTFTITFPTNSYCAIVSVAKSYNGLQPLTRIESRGYNNCDPANARRVERAILVDY